MDTSQVRPRNVAMLSAAVLALGSLAAGASAASSDPATYADGATEVSVATDGAYTLVTQDGAKLAATNSSMTTVSFESATSPTTTVKTVGYLTTVSTATTAPRIADSPYRIGSYHFNLWYAKRYIAYRYHWGARQFRALKKLWTRESHWNQFARNGAGAYGIPQAMPGRKMARYGRDWRRNPVVQIKWGVHYIRVMYGTPRRAWAHSLSHNWY